MTTRASARLAQKWLDSEETPSGSSSSNTKTHAAAKPSQKKRKTTAIEVNKNAISVPRQDDFRRIKGRKGQLKIMTELPLDILMEIFGHLHPLDLLNLSKATKDLRAMLTAKSALYLWKEAYASLIDLSDKRIINIPKCPSHVNILHYTNILFGNDCDFCPARNAKIVHYGVLVRMCNKCAPQKMSQVIHGHLSSLESLARSICARQSFRTTVLDARRYYCLNKEFDWHLRSLKECHGEEARELYIKTQKPKGTTRDFFARHLAGWAMQQKREKRNTLDNIRQQRHKAITDKLVAEGYGAELETRRYHVRSMPGANLRAPLTDKAWDRIKAGIIGVYEWQRQEARKYMMIQTYTRRMVHLRPLVGSSERTTPKPWIVAPVPYIAQCEPFAQIFKQFNENLKLDNSEELLISAQLDAQAHLIPGISLKWRTEADTFLLGLLSQTPDVVMQDDVDKRPLNLATTFFNCECKCAEPMSYPRILVHWCLRNIKIRDRDDDAPSNDETPHDDDDDADDSDDQEEDDDNDTTSVNSSKTLEVYGIPTVTPEGIWNKMPSWWSIAWDQSAISIDEEAVGFAKVIIRVCGEDANTVTSAAMDARTNLRVECTRCGISNPKGRSRHVMTWRAAILHDIENHFEEPPSESGWRVVTDETDLARIAAQEKKIPQKRAIALSNKCCTHCDRQVSPNDNGVLKQHLAQIHKIQEEDAKLEQHVYVALDTSMKTFPCAVNI